MRVIRVNDFLGVVAKTEWAAVRAAQALDAKWSEWEGLPEQANLSGVPAEGRGREGRVPDQARRLEGRDADGREAVLGELLLPVPGTRVAGTVVRGGGVEGRRTDGVDGVAIDAPVPQRVRRGVQVAAGEGAASCTSKGSGCYGQNGHEDACADAAILSREAGAPVRLQWMRHDEHGWDPKGPPQPVDIRAAVDGQGNIVAWESETWIPAWSGTRGTIPLVGFDSAGIAQRAGRWPGSLDENLDPAVHVAECDGDHSSIEGLAAAAGACADAGEGRQLLGGREHGGRDRGGVGRGRGAHIASSA